MLKYLDRLCIKKYKLTYFKSNCTKLIMDKIISNFVADNFNSSAIPLYTFESALKCANRVGEILRDSRFEVCTISILGKPSVGKTYLVKAITKPCAATGHITDSNQRHKKRPVWSISTCDDFAVLNYDHKWQFEPRFRDVSEPFIPPLKSKNCTIIEHAPHEVQNASDMILYISGGHFKVLRMYFNPETNIARHLKSELVNIL